MSAISLTQLRAFVAIGRAGSVNAAAKKLHVSQPAVSSLMHQLEERYGVKLFVRVGRGLQLTETGRRLLALTSQLSSIEEDADQLLSDAGSMRSGLLRIGAVSPYQVMNTLATFSRQYPRVAVQVRFGNSETVMADLVEARIDVAVLAKDAKDARLHALPFRRDPIVALVSRRHEWASRKRIRFDELDGQRMVVREEGSTARHVVDAELRKVGAKPHIVMELGSREAIREAVANGIGVGTLAQAAFAHDPRLRVVAFSNSAVELVTHLFCLRTRREAQTVKAFFDIAEQLASADLFAPRTA